ncbi:MAG: hypothetical protein OEY14_17105 [Myxococcales bacterium]|nr:hypothetical protein [Myxococcales bacterium]
MLGRVTLIVVLLLTASACTSRGRGGRGTPEDGGTPTPDGSASDGGGTPDGSASDGGIVLVDSGTPDGSGGSWTGSCRFDLVDLITTPYCASATTTCVGSCADSPCIEACLSDDPSPDCAACVNINLISCLNANGCQGDWDCISSCGEDMCTGMTGTAYQTCLDTYCADENAAWDTCVTTSTATCPEWQNCLP